jgi:hypothetical protein
MRFDTVTTSRELAHAGVDFSADPGRLNASWGLDET